MRRTLSLLRIKLLGALVQLPYLPRALALVWQAARGWTVAWLVLLLIQGLLPVLTVFLTKGLVDSLTAVIEAGGSGESLRPALLLALAMGGVLLLQELLRGISSWVRTMQAELVRDSVAALVHRQSVTLDLAFYDSPDYYDRLHRARQEASYRPISLLDNLGGLLQNSITLVAMALVLIPYGWWLPIALLVSTLPALYVVVQHAAREHEWRMRTTADERRTWYDDYLLTAREVAAELRLFGTGGYFMSRFQGLRARLRAERLALLKSQALARLAASVSALAVLGLTLAWMVWQTIEGSYSLGDLALIYAAFSQGQGLMRTLLENVGQIYGNLLFLGNLFEFLALEPEVVDPPEPAPLAQPLREGIRFQGVSFHYPGSDRPALQDFSLNIPAGQTVAIVGVNGAGKTTVLKLLCRFYDPHAGSISLDGTDLRELSLEALRRAITVLFQEPVAYQDSVAQNIALSDPASEPDQATLTAAAQASGADTIIANLPAGYNTLLGKWFEGGTDLSVGEWQRIALARAFLRQSAIVILDEPTSAMDPWAEADWLDRFQRLAAGRTSIIITHRFTTARYADVIHVMEGGRIVESGTQEELLALGGRYAQSWRAQMRKREAGEGTTDG
jgi:ATP-binding cassette, subfamily B, bacterial